MERRSNLAAGLRPLRLLPLPPGFFDTPSAAAPEPLTIVWPARGGAFRLTGDAALQARFREALAAYEAAMQAAGLARTSGDVRGFFAKLTETHRCAAALEGFDLPPTDLDRLQELVHRRTQAVARKARRTAP